MQIQPIVVGTAGHIDHGKSTLVKALTGIDPDRLKEEQERGMTIDLGFARFELPDGRTVGIVDVPGHERFVKNMVAGATGIDLVILVVAADDGVMPQTREHLAIMTLLGLTRGLVALTKIDMVAPALVELAREDVRAAVAGTFLEGAPIVPLSATTGAGMAEFRAQLCRLAGAAQPRPATGLFRLPIQRVFSARGFGTVVTGIPLSGTLAVGAAVEILPGGLRAKVRGLQAYSQTVASVRAGHSSAVNLTDVDHAQLRRGMVLATPGFFQGASMLGVQLTALAGLERPIADRTPIRLHSGTAEALGELVLLDCEELHPGHTALAQLRLEEPVVCAPGDRCVVRLASPAWTLGGAVVLEESRHRLKRFKKFVLEELGRAARSLGEPRDLLEVVLSRAQGGAAGSEELAVAIKRPRAETEQLLAELHTQGRAQPIGSPPRWIHAGRLAAATGRVEQALEGWFAEQAHREVIDVRDLRRLTGFEPEFLAALLAELSRAGRLRSEPGGLVRPLARSAPVDTATGTLAQAVRAALECGRFQPPTAAELAVQLSRGPKEILSALELLVDRGEAHAIQKGESYFGHDAWQAAREAIVRNCEHHGSLDIPALRDELGTTRKWLIPLLEHFDAAGLTIRQGANRVLKRR